MAFSNVRLNSAALMGSDGLAVDDASGVTSKTIKGGGCSVVELARIVGVARLGGLAGPSRLKADEHTGLHASVEAIGVSLLGIDNDDVSESIDSIDGVGVDEGGGGDDDDIVSGESTCLPYFFVATD